jgi:C4-dicarboxylate-specific signal transduction histidine kinase
MKDSIAILSGVLREHSIQVDLQLPTQELSLLGNETELQQVFVNLLRNGGDAMIDARVIQPRICIHATAKDDMLNVTIEDNGPGVDPGAERNLFDPFFTTREGGMGMGLAISRSIVENHGGRLCVDENASNGARFRVELPLQGASEAGEQKRG